MSIAPAGAGWPVAAGVSWPSSRIAGTGQNASPSLHGQSTVPVLVFWTQSRSLIATDDSVRWAYSWRHGASALEVGAATSASRLIERRQPASGPDGRYTTSSVAAVSSTGTTVRPEAASASA